VTSIVAILKCKMRDLYYSNCTDFRLKLNNGGCSRTHRSKKKMEEGKGSKEEECRSLLRLSHANWTKT